jgi:hypothetical protein
VLPYFEAFPVLSQVYLEDSWVVFVREVLVRDVPIGLVFDLDAVMTERHPGYRGPLPGERYDYRRVLLEVVGARSVYEPSGDPPGSDADGHLDHGNIDAWHVDDEGWSHLEGSWGTAHVLSAEPVLRFLDER